MNDYEDNHEGSFTRGALVGLILTLVLAFAIYGCIRAYVDMMPNSVFTHK